MENLFVLREFYCGSVLSDGGATTGGVMFFSCHCSFEPMCWRGGAAMVASCEGAFTRAPILCPLYLYTSMIPARRGFPIPFASRLRSRFSTAREPIRVPHAVIPSCAVCNLILFFWQILMWEWVWFIVLKR